MKKKVLRCPSESLFIALRISKLSINLVPVILLFHCVVYIPFFSLAQISMRLIPTHRRYGLSFIVSNSNANQTMHVLFVSMCSLLLYLHFTLFLSLSLGERGRISIETSILVLWIYNFNEIIFGAKETNDLISGYHFRTQTVNPL